MHRYPDNPNQPAHNERVWREKCEAIGLCGKNRGPHKYEATAWREGPEKDKDGKSNGFTNRFVTEFMCMECFTRVTIDTLLKMGIKSEI